MAIPSIALVPSGYKSGTLFSELPTNGNADLDVVRNSTATRINKDGLIESMAINVPLLDYSDGTCPSLLLQPQSKNEITYSNDFTNATWSKAGAGVALAPSVTSNYSVSPDGTLNADRIIFDLNGGTTSSDFAQLQSISATLSGDYTNSVYLKSNTGADYDFTYPNASGSSSSITVTSEWTRIESYATGASGTNTIFKLRLRGGGEATSIYADVSIYGAQVENLSYSTSLIDTSGTTVTRLKDEVSRSGLSSDINSEEGTLFVEIAALETTQSSSRYITLSDGTYNNRLSILFSSGSTNAVRAFYRVGGSSQADLDGSVVDVKTLNKVVFTWSLNSFNLYINGVLTESDTSGNVVAANVFNILSFDEIGNGSNPFYGECKNLQVYKSVLTASQIANL